MFLDFYELSEQPFAASAVSSQPFQGRSQGEALATLTDLLIGGQGSLALIAEPGMGKTTLLQTCLENFRQQGGNTLLFQSPCDSQHILESVLRELGVDSHGMNLAMLLSKLKEVWFAELLSGKRLVLLLDDAENLDDAALEALRHLSKCETSNSRLVDFVISGSPELAQKLEQDNFAALRKKLVQIVRLEGLTPLETAAYIQHRIFAAGHRGDSLFSTDAMTVVAQLSRGVPKDINAICSRALFESYARRLCPVTADIVEKADRNLAVLASSSESVMELPIPSVPATETAQRTAGGVPFFGSAKQAMQFAVSGSRLWIGAAATVLLSAGLALPHAMHKSVALPTAIQQPSSQASAWHSDASPQSPAQPGHSPNEIQANLAAAVSRTLGFAAPKQDATPATTATRRSVDSQLSLTRELGLKINRIVIDPGHGGFDTGAKGPHGLLEKDLCLDVALRLGGLIEENLPGAQVVYTRRDDSHVPLEDRTAIANGADADLFISIHANSSESADVRGVETYYLSLATSREAKEVAIRENALSQATLHDLPELVKEITSNEKIAESKLLAFEIQGKLSQRLQLVSLREKNRGVRQAPFIVLTGANMPAVLSEISFISNANDETLLLQSGQRQRIADGLYRGISGYLDGLQAPAQLRQKLVTENRVNVPSGFERAMAATARNPL